MCGFSKTGEWFQQCKHHGALASQSTSPRLSLTFRLTATTAAKLKFEPDLSRPLQVALELNFHSVSFEDMFAEIKDVLMPDITSMFGKTHTNNGRMSSELMTKDNWPNASAFIYKYSRKNHVGTPMGPLLSFLTKAVSAYAQQPFDWAHATFYPSGDAKLSAHADDESCIASGSDIYALTFMPPGSDARDIFIMPIVKKEKRKRAETAN